VRTSRNLVCSSTAKHSRQRNYNLTGTALYYISSVVNYVAFSGIGGHHAFFETTDRSLAIDVATRLTDGLAIDASEKLSSDFFSGHLNDRELGTARPGVGDYGVSVAADGKHRRLATEEEPVFTVIGATYNVREYDPEGGAERLQAAFAAAIDEALAATVEVSDAS
jgi:hypothetical protein